jgi:hypothetical protein
VARTWRSKFSRAAEVRPGESGLRFKVKLRMVLRAGLQLRNAIKERKAFENFKEAKLVHLPYVLTPALR